MEKTVIIAGGGIAGLATGCYAQMNGYQTRIFEMHDKPGGLCTAWERKGYTIDGCLHWLVGSSPGNGLHRFWQELGMLPGQEIVNMEQYGRYEDSKGRVFTIWCDINRLEQEMLGLSPVDAPFIKEFCKGMRQLTKFNIVPEKPPELSNIIDKVRTVTGVLPVMGAFGRWGRLTIADVAARFKDPLLRRAWGASYSEFSAVAYMMMLAWMHTKSAGYTIGGSLPLARAVEKRYAGLGGSISYKSEVAKIIIENDRAVGVRLSNGEEHRADYIVWAADGHTVIYDMLEGKYINDTIRSYYDNLQIFDPLVYIGLGVNRVFDDLPKMVSGLVLLLDEPINIGGKEIKQFLTHIYNFDPTLAPPGKTCITLMVDSDYSYWKSLRANLPRYREEKAKVAETLISVLDKRFPGFAGQVEMTDVSTPMTFERYTGNWKGCFEGWVPTPKTLRMNMSKTLPGLDSFYMAGQWVSPGGGLPSGAMTGRQVAQMLCHRDRKKFTTALP